MKTMKKTISLLLAVLMLVTCVPVFASAADPITLSYTNIAIVPPSVSPDEMAYGDTWSVLTITGGELYYIAEDGSETLVPGHFEHYRPDGVPGQKLGMAVPFNFVSDDTTKFTSLNRIQSGRVTVKSGTWPTVDIVEGKVKPVITEAPTPVNAQGGMLWGDVTFTGGKAEYEGTEVEGAFVTHKDSANLEVFYGTQIVAVQFIPADTQTYMKSGVSRITFTVKKPAEPIRFVDSEGNDIIPEIKTIPGAVFGETLSIGYSLMSYLNCNRTSFEYFDMDGNSIDGTKVPVGTHQFKAKITSKDESFTPSTLTFILTLEPTPFAVEVRYNGINGGITIVPDNKNVTDEFDVWVEGEFIGTTSQQKIKWKTDTSADYKVTVAHKDTTEGVYVLSGTEYTMNASIRRQIFYSESSLPMTVEGGDKSNNNYAYGGNVLTLTCTDAEFDKWLVIRGGEEWIPEGLTAEDMKKSVISFTMPDCDISVSAKAKSTEGDNSGSGEIGDIFGDLDFGELGEGDSDSAIVNVFNNIIAWIKNIINTIIELFRSIGDNT